MNVSVCFPYRYDESRERTVQWVTRRWEETFPDYELLLGEPDTDRPFNRSQGINRAFQQSHGDVIIAADLDVIGQPDAIEEAVYRAADGEWGFPFRSYYKLDEDFTHKFMQGLPARPIPPRVFSYEVWHHEVNSGLVVISRENFLKIGGFDENFVGWGYEDNAFKILADWHVGRHFRIERGVAFHLWHPGGADVFEQTEKNRERFEKRYVRGNLMTLPKWVT